MQETGERSRKVLPYLFIIILTVWFWSPLVGQIDNISLDDDWLTVYFHHYFIRDSIADYFQLPIWTPYACGGYPISGYPEYPLCSPLILPSLICGEVIGPKVVILFFYLAAAIGMYLLMKNIFRYLPFSAAYSSLVLISSSWLVWAAKDGNYVEMYYFFFPLILFFLMRTQERKGKGFLIYASLLLSLVIFDGNVAFLAIMLFLVLFSLLNGFSILNSRIRFSFFPAAILGMGAVLAVSIAMVKVIPMAGLLMHDSRGIEDYKAASIFAYTFKGLLDSLLHKIPLQGEPVPLSRVFIGILPIIMSAGYVFARPLKSLKWVIVLLVASFLAMGANAPVDLFRGLWHLPLFHSMHKPAKYYDFFIIFAIAAMSGGFLDWLLHKYSQGKKKYTIAFVLILAFASLAIPYLANRKTNGTVFEYKKPVFKKQADFYQIKGIDLPRYDARTPRSNYYFNILRNIGTIDWKANIKVGEFTQPRYFVDKEDNLIANRAYKGESYFNKKANKARISYFSPNRLIIEAETSHEDILTINQNYNKNWQADGLKVFDNKGLIGVRIREPGKHKIILRYKQRGLMAGFIISVFTVTLLLIYLTVRQIKKYLDNRVLKV